MDNIFLDSTEMNEQNYVNENNIIDRDINLVQCENNEQGLYDIDKLIVKDVYRENILLSSKDAEIINGSKTFGFNLNSYKTAGIQYKKNVIGFTLNECIFNYTNASSTGTYLDIVVDEIPYKACKQNPQGFNIVNRIPVISDSGSQIVHYKSASRNHQHLFYPINLSALTIHLYQDGSDTDIENISTISFEFELVILNK
tara:strand:- start:1134 stop:1730 length:597 start_codon:yes stop_codon:yes gene_type:complete